MLEFYTAVDIHEAKETLNKRLFRFVYVNSSVKRKHWWPIFKFMYLAKQETQCMISVVSTLCDKITKIRHRRDGEGRVYREVDDIFIIIKELDEKL